MGSVLSGWMDWLRQRTPTPSNIGEVVPQPPPAEPQPPPAYPFDQKQAQLAQFDRQLQAYQGAGAWGRLPPALWVTANDLIKQRNDLATEITTHANAYNQWADQVNKLRRERQPKPQPPGAALPKATPLTPPRLAGGLEEARQAAADKGAFKWAEKLTEPVRIPGQLEPGPGLAETVRRSVASIPDDPSRWFLNSILDLGIVSADVVQGLADPTNIALLGLMAAGDEAALLPLAARLGFTGQMAADATQKLAQGVRLAKAGNLREAGRMWADAGVQALMIALAHRREPAARVEGPEVYSAVLPRPALPPKPPVAPFEPPWTQEPGVWRGPRPPTEEAASRQAYHDSLVDRFRNALKVVRGQAAKPAGVGEHETTELENSAGMLAGFSREMGMSDTEIAATMRRAGAPEALINRYARPVTMEAVPQAPLETGSTRIAILQDGQEVGSFGVSEREWGKVGYVDYVEIGADRKLLPDTGEAYGKAVNDRLQQWVDTALGAQRGVPELPGLPRPSPAAEGPQKALPLPAEAPITPAPAGAIVHPEQVEETAVVLSPFGVSVDVKFPPTRQFQAGMQKAGQNELVKQQFDRLGITGFSLEAPNQFGHGEQGAIAQSTGQIRINAMADDPEQTIAHELGHDIYNRIPKAAQERIRKYVEDMGIEAQHTGGIIERIVEHFADVMTGRARVPPNIYSDFFDSELGPRPPAPEKEGPEEPARPPFRSRVRTWEDVEAEHGYIISADHLAEMVRQHGDRMVVVKDVNGGRSTLPASVVAQLMDTPAHGFIREVFLKGKATEGGKKWSYEPSKEMGPGKIANLIPELEAMMRKGVAVSGYGAIRLGKEIDPRDLKIGQRVVFEKLPPMSYLKPGEEFEVVAINNVGVRFEDPETRAGTYEEWFDLGRARIREASVTLAPAYDFIPDELGWSVYDRSTGAPVVAGLPTYQAAQEAVVPQPVKRVLQTAIRPVRIGGELISEHRDPVATRILPNWTAEHESFVGQYLQGMPKYLAGGSYNIVLDIGGGKVARMGLGVGPTPDLPEVLKPIDTFAANGLRVDIMPKVDTSNITLKDVKEMEKKLSRKGYLWYDSGTDNMGRLPDGTLVVIDLGGVRPKGEGGYVMTGIERERAQMGLFGPEPEEKPGEKREERQMGLFAPAPPKTPEEEGFQKLLDTISGVTAETVGAPPPAPAPPAPEVDVSKLQRELDALLKTKRPKNIGKQNARSERIAELIAQIDQARRAAVAPVEGQISRLSVGESFEPVEGVSVTRKPDTKTGRPRFTVTGKLRTQGGQDAFTIPGVVKLIRYFGWKPKEGAPPPAAAEPIETPLPNPVKVPTLEEAKAIAAQEQWVMSLESPLLAGAGRTPEQIIAEAERKRAEWDDLQQRHIQGAADLRSRVAAVVSPEELEGLDKQRAMLPPGPERGYQFWQRQLEQVGGRPPAPPTGIERQPQAPPAGGAPPFTPPVAVGTHTGQYADYNLLTTKFIGAGHLPGKMTVAVMDNTGYKYDYKIDVPEARGVPDAVIVNVQPKVLLADPNYPFYPHGRLTPQAEAEVKAAIDGMIIDPAVDAHNLEAAKQYRDMPMMATAEGRQIAFHDSGGRFTPDEVWELTGSPFLRKLGDAWARVQEEMKRLFANAPTDPALRYFGDVPLHLLGQKTERTGFLFTPGVHGVNLREVPTSNFRTSLVNPFSGMKGFRAAPRPPKAAAEYKLETTVHEAVVHDLYGHGREEHSFSRGLEAAFGFLRTQMIGAMTAWDALVHDIALAYAGTEENLRNDLFSPDIDKPLEIYERGIGRPQSKVDLVGREASREGQPLPGELPEKTGEGLRRGGEGLVRRGTGLRPEGGRRGEEEEREFSSNAADFVDRDYLDPEYETGLWHVTTARDKVLAEGLKPRSQTGSVGLSGGFEDEAPDKISVTFDETHASMIAERLELAVAAARDEITPRQALEKILSDAMLSDDTPEEVAKAIWGDIKFHREESPNEYDDWDAFYEAFDKTYDPGDAYKVLQVIDDALPDIFTDVEWTTRVGFTARKEDVAKIDPRQITVLEVEGRTGAKPNHIPDERELRFRPGDIRVKQQEKYKGQQQEFPWRGVPAPPQAEFKIGERPPNYLTWYRGGMSVSGEGTAGDVVRYEQEMLGNYIGVTPEKLVELDRYPYRSATWVTPTREGARRYGQVSEVKFVDPEIIASDRQGGYLILDRSKRLPPAARPVEERTYYPVETGKRTYQVTNPQGEARLLDLTDRQVKDFEHQGYRVWIEEEGE